MSPGHMWGIAPGWEDRWHLFAFLLILWLSLAGGRMTSAAEGSSAMIATVHPLATDAGLEVLRSGGNAVDAAIRAALTLGVVDGHNSGIGGGCFLLIRGPDGKITAIDGRETAGAAATRAMFLRDGKADTSLSQTGPLAAGVPGEIAALALAAHLHGTRSLAQALEPAAKIAAEGFPIDRITAGNIRGNQATFQKYPASAAVYLKPDGSPYVEGEILRQPDLCRTYLQIAKHGPEWFYCGEFAERTAAWMRDNGGILTREDFSRYEAILREPITSSYRDLTVIGFPPPSSGGIHVAQILGMLERFDLATIEKDNPGEAAHLVLEAMKLAFADRAFWLGDADFVAVPRGLHGHAYLETLAARIDPQRTTPVASHGVPDNWRENTFTRGHTTHLSVVDGHGYWVSMTMTVNTGFGSKVVIPGTGVVLNNEMDDFSIEPGVPNAFGLVGAENNAVEPGKRPLSSMSPTLILKDGVPVMAVGGAGGPKIISQVVLTTIRHFDYGLALEDAVGQGRIHHQWRPDKALVESGVPETVIATLEAKGHIVERTGHLGTCQAIVRLPDGRLVGVHDPRVPGKAAGLP